MAIVRVKVHPAIGIARVGNSPDEFFIGPERVYERPAPQEGFKDDHCRVKRQGARFRAFAYHDDGKVVELTADTAQIAWTVEVANKKAAVSNRNPDVDAALLTIAPAAITVSGPQQRKVLDDGAITLDGVKVSVPLGEVRTDDAGNLVFLGGFGHSASPANKPIHSFYSNEGWYDDVCDGPIRATVNIGGESFEADPAWVIVAPPKFAPQFDSVVTLYDTLFQQAAKEKWVTAPAVPSYTKDIQPILQRARDTRWTTNIGSAKHAWPDPVYDSQLAQHIYGRLRGTDGAVDGNANNDNMPALAGGAQLTQVQLDALFAWQGGNFERDWAGPPQPIAAYDPAGLDRAALEACVGAAFFPGIEAGGVGQIPILDLTTFVGADDPLRIDPAVRGPGDLSAFMALPWQADFNACDDGWWPVPRPNWVKVPAENAYRDWDRDVDSGEQMVESWHRLGFVVRVGDEFVETERNDVSANVTLLTPHLDFGEVAQGPTGIPRYAARAIVFEVNGQGGPVTLAVDAEPNDPRFIVLTPSVTVNPPNGTGLSTVRLVVAYQTGATLDAVQDTLQVAHVGTGVRWSIGVEAQTVARKPTAAALVLDRAESDDAGLQEASQLFVELLHEGDALAVAHDVGQSLAVRALDAPGARDQLKAAVLDAHGGALAAGSGEAIDSLVFVTDGSSDAPAGVAARTYAVGLAPLPSASGAHLREAADNRGGYFLSAGSRREEQGYWLKQYFLQILSELKQTAIALVQQGSIPHGGRQALSFHLSEADDAIEVIVLAPDDAELEIRLQTPDGFIISPDAADSGVQYAASGAVRFYRISLPTELAPDRFDQEGTWRVLLHYGEAQPQGEAQVYQGTRTPLQLRARPSLLAREPAAAPIPVPQRPRSLPYSVNVHAYSRVSLRARVTQSGSEPGARMRVSAALLVCGELPVEGATFWVDVTAPDGREHSVPLAGLDEAGDAFAELEAAAPGSYRLRVRARALSPRGHAYQRELTLTAAVWHGHAAAAASGAPATKQAPSEQEPQLQADTGRIARPAPATKPRRTKRG